MTISGNGQVSIPAAARARWGTRKVLVVDLGDRVVMRPAADTDAASQLQGKYANRGPDSSAARRAARRAEDTTARRHG
jgi:bifunctional DNA-binding transcriptional regulator/antitoxin component of YhaV-PrlF toxin-antitoxin module